MPREHVQWKFGFSRSPTMVESGKYILTHFNMSNFSIESQKIHLPFSTRWLKDPKPAVTARPYSKVPLFCSTAQQGECHLSIRSHLYWAARLCDSKLGDVTVLSTLSQSLHVWPLEAAAIKITRQHLFQNTANQYLLQSFLLSEKFLMIYQNHKNFSQ